MAGYIMQRLRRGMPHYDAGGTVGTVGGTSPGGTGYGYNTAGAGNGGNPYGYDVSTGLQGGVGNAYYENVNQTPQLTQGALGNYGYNTGQINQTVGQQGALSNLLLQAAQGQGPAAAAAQQQLQQATQQNQAQTAATIAQQRGINAGAAQRQAAQTQAANQQNAALQSAQLKTGIELQAAGQAGNALAQQGQTQATQNQLASQIVGQNAQMYQQTLQGNVAAAAAAQGHQIASNNQQEQLAGSGVGAAGALGAALISSSAAAAAHGGQYGRTAMPRRALPLMGGGHVPGRAVVAGDSPRNDTHLAMLSSGEIVLPRSIALAEDPAAAAAEFVRAIERQGPGKKAPPVGPILRKVRGMTGKRAA